MREPELLWIRERGLEERQEGNQEQEHGNGDSNFVTKVFFLLFKAISLHVHSGRINTLWVLYVLFLCTSLHFVPLKRNKMDVKNHLSDMLGFKSKGQKRMSNNSFRGGVGETCVSVCIKHFWMFIPQNLEQSLALGKHTLNIH